MRRKNGREALRRSESERKESGKKHDSTIPDHGILRVTPIGTIKVRNGGSSGVDKITMISDGNSGRETM